MLLYAFAVSTILTGCKSDTSAENGNIVNVEKGVVSPFGTSEDRPSTKLDNKTLLNQTLEENKNSRTQVSDSISED